MIRVHTIPVFFKKYHDNEEKIGNNEDGVQKAQISKS